MITAVNLGLRFVLEIVGLIAIGYWGFHRGDGILRWVLMLVPVLLIATAWAVFRVPGDGGDPVVAIPGTLRLLFEFAVFGLAVLALWTTDQRALAIVLLIVVVGHYAVDWQRVAWLIRQ